MIKTEEAPLIGDEEGILQVSRGDDLTISNDDLQGLFQAIGREYGYDAICAEFVPFKEFKSKWRRSGTSVSFEISDYIQEANSLILNDYSHALFHRVQRGNGDLYSDRMREWLQSSDFVRLNQPTYLERSRNLAVSPLGCTYDLKEALRELQDEGLVSDAQDAVISWTKKGNHYRVGYCSVLMKVIAVSSALDRPEIPDYVHRYVLYHELLHLEKGLTLAARHHTSSFRNQERLFPRWREAEGWLQRLASGKA